MAEDGKVYELTINLSVETRSDGSVFVESPDLPLFTAIGKDEEHAYDLVKTLLPEYLRLNVPNFVDLQSIPSAKTKIITGLREEKRLPTSWIARAGDDKNAGGKQTAAGA